jgi:hypothetical protein
MSLPSKRSLSKWQNTIQKSNLKIIAAFLITNILTTVGFAIKSHVYYVRLHSIIKIYLASTIRDILILNQSSVSMSSTKFHKTMLNSRPLLILNLQPKKTTVQSKTAEIMEDRLTIAYHRLHFSHFTAKNRREHDD